MAGADSSAGPGTGPGRRWEVALSFAAAQRDYVEQVARALRARGVRCFYDADEQIELWGKYLAEELPAIYSEQAAAVVVFISAEYAARDWTRLERRAALNRAARERREYVLPARFDDTLLPGLLSDMVAVDLRGRTPEQFAGLIAAKLAALGVTAPVPAASTPETVRPTVPTPGRRTHDTATSGESRVTFRISLLAPSRRREDLTRHGLAGRVSPSADRHWRGHSRRRQRLIAERLGEGSLDVPHGQAADERGDH